MNFINNDFLIINLYIFILILNDDQLLISFFIIHFHTINEVQLTIILKLNFNIFMLYSFIKVIYIY